jgi:NTP pyrophosphatase (non-canonical NTP hydrolase)
MHHEAFKGQAEPCKSCQYNRGFAGCALSKCVLENIPPFMEPIKRFAQAMFEKMVKRSTKRSGWDDPVAFPMNQRLERLLAEMEEFAKAIDRGEQHHVREECVDVANQIMMIWYVMDSPDLPEDWSHDCL